MKAYAVRVLSWPELLIVYSAKSRAHAIYLNLCAAKEAGYKFTWTEHRVTRCPMYDHIAATKAGELGGDDGEWRGGCLAVYAK